MQVLRLNQVCKRIGLCDARVYQLLHAGKFPKPIRLGARAIGFIESEIDDWIAARAASARVEFSPKTSKKNQPAVAAV